MTHSGPDIDALKSRMKATWMAGDFGRIAATVQAHAEAFVARRRIEPGTRVLDVACGTGNVAVPAAEAGGIVTAVDIARNLLQQGRVRAREAGVRVDFDEGDVEDLPYPDVTFDLVLSMYGAMFAPRPERAARELARVCRPGGRIVMANWPPDSFIGRMAKVTAGHVAPPSGVPSPLAWSDEEVVRERFGDAALEVRTARVPVRFRYPLTPAETVSFFRTYYGPTQRAFEALSDGGQEALQRDLESLWADASRAEDGTIDVRTEYVEVVAIRA